MNNLIVLNNGGDDDDDDDSDVKISHISKREYLIRSQPRDNEQEFFCERVNNEEERKINRQRRYILYIEFKIGLF